MSKFNEERRIKATEDKREANLTRDLCKDLANDFSNENLQNLLSNYQGIILINHSYKRTIKLIYLHLIQVTLSR